jgi:hypothetical protein
MQLLVRTGSIRAATQKRAPVQGREYLRRGSHTVSRQPVSERYRNFDLASL